MQPKFVAAQKILLKQKPLTFVNGLLGFITLGIYTPLEALLAGARNCMSCPSIWATLSALLINILLGSFQLFLHSDQPLSEGEIIVQQCLPVGEAALSTPETWWLHAWQTALMCNRRRPAASSRRASFSALASANSFVYFASSAAASRWRICMSVICRVRQLQFSGIFVALGFVGNGVITVMINSPWQADDDADNQSENNRGNLLAINLSDRSARFFQILQSGCSSLMLELTITSARQWSPDIAATVDCLTDITDQS